MVNNSGGRAKPAAQPSGGFEPGPPAKPIRPPRRPLTGQDFPELAQHEAALHSQRDLGMKRRGGILDWVTGRSRNAGHEDNGNRQDPGFENPNAPHHHEQPGSHADQSSDSSHHEQEQGGAQDTAGGRNVEEPFEIPNFFKKVGD